MTDTNVLQFSQPGTFADPLTEVLRNGAQALLRQAVETEGGKFAREVRRRGYLRWPPTAGAPRPSAGAQDRDRHRSGGGSLPAGARPRWRRARAHSVLVGDSAALRAAIEKSRGADSDPLSQRHLDRRLRAGIGGAAGP